MKDSQYLTHDIGARNDPKLIDLQMEMGGQGLGIFWCLVEMLWENGGYIPANYKGISFALRWCKPSEIEKVVTGFGLFHVEDGMIYSHSALERIRNKLEKAEALSQVRREAGRAGGIARARNLANAKQEGSNCQANATETDSNCLANVKQNVAINKLNNKLINKDIINNNAPTALDIYEIFFFIRNFKDPDGEVKRFLDHYEECGWTYQDGSSVTDWAKAARDWKPLKAGTRYDQEALNWYRAVWNAARGHITNADMIFLYNLTNIRRDGQKVALRYRNESTARAAASFILDNSLTGDYEVDFRIST